MPLNVTVFKNDTCSSFASVLHIWHWNPGVVEIVPIFEAAYLGKILSFNDSNTSFCGSLKALQRYGHDIATSLQLISCKARKVTSDRLFGNTEIVSGLFRRPKLEVLAKVCLFD